ncbi:hypothetical protein [Desulfonatronum thiodismutans]|uniref:hypothetical protein n=1 Tax=Desulfonatronum thiodismutans TaxID=159290 RepID=UPI001267D5FB|nr:hypothetical protein [Desulfonatronum thiodismutans]
MARHILNGENFVYYWGQNYMGSLEAYTAAFFFKILNTSDSFVLKMVPLFYCVLLIIFSYYYLCSENRKLEALFFLALMSFPPLFFLVWSLKARGGYIETILFGILIFYFATKTIQSSKNLYNSKINIKFSVNNNCLFYLLLVLQLISALIIFCQVVYGGVYINFYSAKFSSSSFIKPIFFFFLLLSAQFFLRKEPFVKSYVVNVHWIYVSLLAFLCGLAWWTNQLVIFFLFPALIIISLSIHKLFFSPNYQILFIIFFGLFSFLGGLPMWYYSFFTDHASITSEAIAPSELWISQFTNFFSIGLPRLIGIFSEKNQDIFTLILDYSVAVIYLASFSYVSFRVVKKIISKFNNFNVSINEFIFIFLFFYPFLFSVTSFGGFVTEPRYLLPFIFVFQLAICFFIARIYKIIPFLSFFIIFILIGSSFSQYKEIDFQAMQPWVKSRKVPLSLNEFYEFAEDKNINAVYSDYWIAYRITFESSENIISTVYPKGSTDRNPDYTMFVDSNDNFAYIIMNSVSKGFELQMHNNNIHEYDKFEIWPMVIYFNLSKRI